MNRQQLYFHNERAAPDPVQASHSSRRFWKNVPVQHPRQEPVKKKRHQYRQHVLPQHPEWLENIHPEATARHKPSDQLCFPYFRLLQRRLKAHTAPFTHVLPEQKKVSAPTTQLAFVQESKSVISIRKNEKRFEAEVRARYSKNMQAPRNLANEGEELEPEDLQDVSGLKPSVKGKYDPSLHECQARKRRRCNPL